MTTALFKVSLLTASLLTGMALSACKETTRSTADFNSADGQSSSVSDQIDKTSSKNTAQNKPIAKPAPSASTVESRAVDMLTGNVPTLQQAKEFLEQAELDIAELNDFASRAAWVNANFITEDTDWLASLAGEKASHLSTRLANEAKRFKDLKLPESMARKMESLLRGSHFPAPEKDGAAKQLSKIMTSLNSQYGKGKFTYRSTDPQFAHMFKDTPKGELTELNLGQLNQIISKSRDPKELSAIWNGWREISPPMKNDYAKMVEIINEGARELGYNDAGALWRAGYDMPADDFTKEADRLWGQVKPLYDELHCYVRAELNAEYGDEVVPLDGPMRADILGNMWGQSWGNIYDIVKPKSKQKKASKTVDVTKLLVKENYDPIKMVKQGESFFTSLGFEPLPQTFWDRSLFVKPQDREVTCHASAWNLDDKDDVRIKMCIKVTGEDFQVVHHELGHNFYQRAYKNQSVFFRSGANDGFHEAIGDMIALSITPEYLVKIGLLNPKDVPSDQADTELLMQQALDKVAFLPFGLMVDQWRWKVFSGEYSPADYNRGWWQLREQYQGLVAPNARPNDAFDPGAKFHIPGNTPYMRYFLAHILQFQFHKAACDLAGFEGPLHKCSIYGNEAVGTKFNAMLEMGSSKPWPEALEAFTGTRQMDGSAILEYFDPLMVYLKSENEGRKCGWSQAEITPDTEIETP